MTRHTLLISAPQLQALQASQTPCMVFDCSFDLMNPEAGAAQFDAVHIAGARYIHLNRHLSEKNGGATASGGRHPLPTQQNFAAWLIQTGFSPAMQAVVYDRNGANYCGRLWWMLKWLGHDAVAVLDGGLQAWQAAGGAVAQGATPALTPTPAPASFMPKWPLPQASTAQAAIKLVAATDIVSQLNQPTQTLIDARGGPRFRGEVEPLDPVAGHIPGALNRPFGDNLGPDGLFKSATVLRAEFDALLAGRDPASVVHHCGSGVSAVPNLLAMQIAGYPPTALYAGSWSDWCADTSRPVAKG
jgi:thiosulfate/3-mercaptopyruvate sulfurtransferase